MQPNQVGYINYVYKFLYDAPKGTIYIDDHCKESSRPFFISCIKRAIKDSIGSNLKFSIKLKEELNLIEKK